MFFELKKGELRKIINLCIVNAGSERNLSKVLDLSKGKIYRYKNEFNISKKDLMMLLDYLDKNLVWCSKRIVREFVDNWGRIKGGINCVRKKKKDGKFEANMEMLRRISSKRMREWHRHMKSNFPREYYIWQYERFKKVGRGYILKLKNGVAVRNSLEKDVGDFLISEGHKFDYEPLISVRGKFYFPDFKLNNNIIEVTGWKHPTETKIIKLKGKIVDYQRKGFNVVLFIPHQFRKFYKAFDRFIISDLRELRYFLKPQ